MFEGDNPYGGGGGRGRGRGFRGGRGRGRGQGSSTGRGYQRRSQSAHSSRTRDFSISQNGQSQWKLHFGFRRLTDLKEKESNEILLTCTSKLDLFRDALNDTTHDRNMIHLILRCSAKACECSSLSQKLLEFLRVFEDSKFYKETLIGYLKNIEDLNSSEIESCEDVLLDILTIYSEFKSRMPHTTLSFFGVSAIVVQVIQTISDTCGGLSANLETAYTSWKAAKEATVEQISWRQNRRHQTINEQDQWEPPEDFRDIPVFPEAVDIKVQELPFLRRNKVQGRYTDLNHYLDVQFRLLREDFISPLREGVNKYIEAVNAHGRTNRLNDVRIYSDVQIVSPVCNNIGLCQRVSFSCPGLKRIRWESSKRLIFGSLVVLSPDEFETFLFATVANRDLKEVKRGLIDIHFECDHTEISKIVPGTNFIMAETTAYFEAYRHVLLGLRNMAAGDLPFEKYIVECETDVEPPAYLRRLPSARMDLRPLVDEDILLRDESRQPGRRRNEGAKPVYTFSARSAMANNIKVTDERRWPDAGLLQLDTSQFHAVQMALSKEFVIIQGPPGTGKTYIGLKIVRALLHNRSLWSINPLTNTDDNSPLLVVCYTNHALDQFLEGIIKFYKGDVLRLGGRSSSETIKNFSIGNKRLALRRNRSLPKAIHMERTRTRIRMKALRASINVLAERIEKAKMEILHEECLERFIGPRLYTRLINGFEFIKQQQFDPNEFRPKRRKKESAIVEWLGFGQILKTETDVRIPAVDVQSQQINLDPEEEDFIDVVDEIEALTRQRQLDIFEDDENVDENDALVEVTSMLSQLGINKTTVALNVSKIDESDNDNRQQQSVNDWEIQPHQRKKMVQNLKQALRSSDTMTDVEVLRLRDVWSLSQDDKWRLYRYWIKKYCEVFHTTIDKSESEFREICEASIQIQMQEDKEIMKQSTVIGMTTTCAAKYQPVLKEIGARVIIVEEAAEVLEAHVITTLSKKCEHLILIGDHQQLKPNPTVYRLARHFNLEVSLFERMIKNKLDYRCLELQHRMRPEIAKIMKIIYPHLRNHDVVENFNDIRGVSENVFFIDHSEPESSDEESRSHSNEHEAEYIAGLCKYLLLQGYTPDQITVLTLYSGQLFNLKHKMPKSTFNGVKMTVVDNFQGEENDIILLSLVRSNNDDNIGFLSIENRVCVALSRAKKGFYVIGNFSMLARKNELWKKIVSLAQKQEFINGGLLLYCQNHPEDKGIVAMTASDFKKAPEGGCMKPCEFRLPCGHTCTKACHVADKKHEKFKCMKRCTKTVCDDGHQCGGSCSQKCPPCKIPVQKKMPLCGHIQDVPCSVDPIKWSCTDKCRHILPCGHICTNLCGESHTSQCTELITKSWPCGHSAKVMCFRSSIKCPSKCESELDCGHLCKGTCGECYQGRLHKACKQKCKRTLVCEHTCQDYCSNCPPCTKRCENRCVHSKCQKQCGEQCTPCQEQCDWMCKHVKCSKRCFEPCDRPRCDRRCRHLLKCGHRCIGVCGEPCPTLCRTCDNKKVTEIFFGSEDDPKAKFVQLEDCNHLFEKDGLDQWMDNDQMNGNIAIKLKECPRCKTPIRRNLRYGNMIKQALNDIENVKKHLIGNKTRTEGLKLSIVRGIRRLPPSDSKLLSDHMEYNMHQIISENNLVTLENQVRFLTALNDIKKRYHESLVKTSLYDKEHTKALQRIDEIREFLVKRRSYFTSQELADIMVETECLTLLLKLIKLKEQKAKSGLKLDASYSVQFLRAERYLTGGQRFDDKRKVFVTKFLQVIEEMMPKTGLRISDDERIAIVNAMQLTKGHWYKCTNGHVYAIGDCGGATEESVCPECKSAIGGKGHRLRSDNAVATEMDGARHPAWSEQNNMENYDPFQIRF